MYASPIFQARAGSTHGYDVSDPLRLNAEIGTEAQLSKIAQRLKELDMGWLQDIVPNHMAYDPINPWIHNLLEKGLHSEYAAYFDVDWNHPTRASVAKSWPRFWAAVGVGAGGGTTQSALG